MTTTNQLTLALKNIREEEHIEETTHAFITQQLEWLRRPARPGETTPIDIILNIISNRILNKEQTKEFNGARAYLLRVIYRHRKFLNANANNQVIEEPDNIINRSVEDQEEQALDSMIPKYNKRTWRSPMSGVSLNEKIGTFAVSRKNQPSTSRTNLIEACQLVIDSYCETSPVPVITEGYQKQLLRYNQHVLIQYLYEGVEYYDAMHILYHLGTKTSATNDKYKILKEGIKLIIQHKNQHHGYLFRKMVTVTSIKKVLARTSTPEAKNLYKLLGLEIHEHKVLRVEVTCINHLMTAFADCIMKTQYYVNGYKVDLYFPDYKLVIECDENDHKTYDADKDAARQMCIENTIGTTFIRFDPYGNNFDIMYQVFRIRQHMNNFNNKLN